MREIKFRAWLNMQEEMLYANIFGAGELFAGRDCQIMQYTGIKDKNGKEIYEGDIVDFIDSRGDGKGEVYFELGKFQVMNFYNGNQDIPNDAFSEYADLEIIGNIYESPELLSGN